VLALSEGAVPAGLPRTNHFGFGLEDPAQVRSARERFRRAGVTATEWQDDPGFVPVQVTEPVSGRVSRFMTPTSSSRRRRYPG
jgi:hypothetical protein